MDTWFDSDSLSSDLSRHIRKLRTKLHIDQKRFARQMKVSLSLVRAWEAGNATPSAPQLKQIVALEEKLRTSNTRSTHEAGGIYTFSPEVERVDFCGDAESVRIAVEGERLNYGYLFNPAFATEVALIEPLPHQRIAVYEHMLPQSRLRFLLADDAGAGKTIMTGLYIREMLARRLISRILIVPPAGLVGNWEQEMRTLFNLNFQVVTGNDAKYTNPFTEHFSDLLIVSVDTLAGDRMFERLQDQDVVPYDLVVFDEAHKLAASRDPDLRIRKTVRFQLAEALTGVSTDDPEWALNWSCHHLLLLSATPHMGRDFPYYCLWSLLEPEALSSFQAFSSYPEDARRRHFIRRTKEEMVDYQGKPIYPERQSSTMSYDLTQGPVSEQYLYDETTRYIHTYYNRAELLNRSAARLAMSVFQRRLASSTWALLCSLNRRKQKLQRYIEELQSGKLKLQQFEATQSQLNEAIQDTFEKKTADEEESEPGEDEENQKNEDQALESTTATSLEDLEAELAQIEILCSLAEEVYVAGEESKFEKMRSLLGDPDYADQKFLIFTEHRDTLDFLIHRLEGLGFTGQIAQISGGMNYLERGDEVERFRKRLDEGGARFLIATDAAGEGINLQVCWIMINYDIPWNPARLEQRMGRIHRYGQKHDPVLIFNLVASKTREGRVMKILLDKLESIRRALGNDKVFDVLGQLFEGISLREYMERALHDEEEAKRAIDGRLTKEQVQSLQKHDRQLFGAGSAVRSELPRLNEELVKDAYRTLLPGYMRRFVEKAAPLIDIKIEGSLDSLFSLQPRTPGSLDWLNPYLEIYAPERRSALTLYPSYGREHAIFLHPGEPVFDHFREFVCHRFAPQALQGAVFVDPTAERPYFYHLLEATVIRQADPELAPLRRGEMLEKCLLAFKHSEDGEFSDCSIEQLLLLRGTETIPADYQAFANTVSASIQQTQRFARHHIEVEYVENRRQMLSHTMPERIEMVMRGFEYQELELGERRTRLREKIDATNDPHAKSELTKVRARQKNLETRKFQARQVIEREPQLIIPGTLSFIAHALVVPSQDPEERERFDANVEELAMQYVMNNERDKYSAWVRDVSIPARALAAGLSHWPGFDLLSKHPSGEERAIEVKGRVGFGSVEMSENEYAKACNLGDRYWLYVVFECEKIHPRLVRVQNPFAKLIVRSKGSVVVDTRSIFDAAEVE